MRSVGERCGVKPRIFSRRTKDSPASASYNIGGLVLVLCRSVWEQDRSQTIFPGAHQTVAKAKVDTALISSVEKVLRMDYVPAVMREM
jgi:hypothetical protein